MAKDSYRKSTPNARPPSKSDVTPTILISALFLDRYRHQELTIPAVSGCDYATIIAKLGYQLLASKEKYDWSRKQAGVDV